MSVWQTLDNLWKSTQNLGAEIYSLDKSTYVKDQGVVGQFLIWTGSLILMAVSVVVFNSRCNDETPDYYSTDIYLLSHVWFYSEHV